MSWPYSMNSSNMRCDVIKKKIKCVFIRIHIQWAKIHLHNFKNAFIWLRKVHTYIASKKISYIECKTSQSLTYFVNPSTMWCDVIKHFSFLKYFLLKNISILTLFYEPIHYVIWCCKIFSFLKYKCLILILSTNQLCVVML